MSQRLPTCSTPAPGDEVLWEIDMAHVKHWPKQRFGPTTICLIPQQVNRRCTSGCCSLNAIIPYKLVIKLRKLSLCLSLYNWILDFLISRPQSAQIGNETSSSINIKQENHNPICSVPCFTLSVPITWWLDTAPMLS